MKEKRQKQKGQANIERERERERERESGGEQERAREGERDWGLQSTNDDWTSPVSETGHTIWCGKDTVAVVEVPVAVVVDSVVAVTVVETI